MLEHECPALEQSAVRVNNGRTGVSTGSGRRTIFIDFKVVDKSPSRKELYHTTVYIPRYISYTIMTEAQKKRYALVGTGGRSSFYYTAIATTYHGTSEIVALCDTNQTRMNYANANLESLGHGKVPTYLATDFDTMISVHKPDEVIVTTGPDRTHNIYIVRALELGCNVVTEKPSACPKDVIQES